MTVLYIISEFSENRSVRTYRNLWE